MVRWLSSGELEYIGRNDFQVKIRGFRIELGEIESLLIEYKGVKQVVVLARENKETNNKYLLAYYTSSDGDKLNEEEIFSYLATKLPEYMIPSAIMHLDKLPLTLNGKLDRKALPDPVFGSNINNYVAPRNKLESKLCSIFADVIGLDVIRVGIKDDFFRLGGNSISAIKLVGKINIEFKSSIKIKDIFEHKTIEGLCALIIKSENAFVYKDFMIKEINQDKLYELFAMNNVQQAYYLGRGASFDLGNIGTHIYTESIYKELDVARLEVSLNKLIERHLSLRTIFTDKGQLHLAEVPYIKIPYYEFTSFDELLSIRNKLAHKVYDPGTFPIFDFVVSKLGNEYILHISIDGLIMDAMSFTIFFKEWRCLYNDIEYKLPELKLSYRDYIIEHEKIRESKLFYQARKYWGNKADLYQLDLKLPILKEAHEVKDSTFARVTKTITNSIWNQVLEKALNLNISPTALLLCVYGKVLSYWSAQNKVTINLTLFNRLPLHAQIHDILGDFTVLELFNYSDSQTDSIKKVLSNCHDELLNDIDHNLFDGIDLQRLLRKKYGLSSNDIISPVVLTSILTGSTESQELLNPINDSYKGEQYSITQTPQVWLDNKAYNTVDGFVAEWDYVEELFAKDTIEAMHYAYCDLIEELAKLDWDKDTFPSITLPSEDSAIIEKANNAIQAISGDTLYGRCEQIVKVHKLQKEIAVIENNQSYSYETLLDDATKLAKYLFSNCKDQELIAVLCEKGYFQVLATFGIMKAGFGYLPLNIEWPSERMAEILEQAGVSTIVITSSQAKVMSSFTTVVIEDVLHSNPSNITLPNVNADSIAYVIFTSGSTGKPKGVTITHKSVMNTIDAVNKRFKIDHKDKVFALSELSFDLSVYDIYGMLSVGGGIVFPEQDKTKEPKHWLALLREHKVTIWNTVPQLADLLVNETKEAMNSLRLFLLSGDWISLNLPDNIKQSCPQACVMSLGGATEGGYLVYMV